MPDDRGRTLPLSLPRRWIGDMLHAAAKVPTFAVERPIRVPALLAARQAVPDPPGWHALVVKGLGMASMRVPELRQAYLPHPWPRLYEAPYSVASVVFERPFGPGEPVPFFAPIMHPERMTLGQIRDKVAAWKRDPIEAHGALRKLVRNAKPPLPVRRLLWWTGLNGSGYFRARNFGTFAVNSVRAMNLKVLTFRSPLTSIWYYGAVSDAGVMDLAMALDHRVLDGRAVDRAFRELETALNDDLAAEVRGLGESS